MSEKELASLCAKIEKLQFRDGDRPDDSALTIAIETGYNAAIADVLALLKSRATP